MKKNKGFRTVWEHYLTKEIGIEFKACLHFFCILVFYSIYRLICGSCEANILHMTEMIFLAYTMGYVQVYLLSNFDEGEQLGRREIFYAILCSLVYAGIAYAGEWFDRNMAVGAGFWCYMMLVYGCTYLVYKSKREIDGKILNEDLKAFQERRRRDGECD